MLILVLVFSFLSSFNQEPPTGKEIFVNNCMKCHGEDGTRGKWGAKNLRESKMSDEQLLSRISNGKGIMPAWKNRLSDNEIKMVRDYIKTLRN